MVMNNLWVKNVLAPFFSGQEIGTSNTGYYHSNQSLDAFINRHFTNYAVEKYGGLHKKIDWVIFSEKQAKFAGMLIKAILVLGMSVLTFWKKNCKTTWFYELSAWLILLLWIWPSSWINHYIFTMPAICCLLLGVDLKKPLQFKNNFYSWMLIWFFIFIHLGYGSYMQSFSPIFLGSISLLLGCIHLLVKEKKHICHRLHRCILCTSHLMALPFIIFCLFGPSGCKRKECSYCDNRKREILMYFRSMVVLFYRAILIYVALTVLSVWLLRKNRKTVYRGGGAMNLLEEFQNYGLSKTSMYIVGTIKIITAILLLCGMYFDFLVFPAAAVMALFMLAAIYFHLKIQDPFVPIIPSLLMFLLCISLIAIHFLFL